MIKVKPPNKAILQKALARTVPGIEIAMRSELGRIGVEFEARSKAIAPVETGPRPRRTPGTLRDSIGWVWADSGSERIPKRLRAALLARARGAGMRIGTVPGIVLVAGSKKAFYAQMVEFGTAPGRRGFRAGASPTDVKQHKDKGRIIRRTHPGSRPQPFFWPVYRLMRKNIGNRLSRAMTKAIRNAGFNRK